MRTRTDRTIFGHICTALVPILLSVLAMGGLLLVAQPASAADSGQTVTGQICMQRVFIGNTTGTVTNANQLNCTASDVKIAEAISATNLDTGTNSCIQGTPFTLQATFKVDVTANIRYDEGFFFRIDGGTNARGDGTSATGTCSLSDLNPSGVPGQQLDGDTCGDLTAGEYTNVTVTIPGVACVDDGTGHVRLPNCVSWHSNQGTVCNVSTPMTTTQAFQFPPDTKSKCTCNDNFSIPILVETGGITVTKDASPASLPEPGGEFTYSVTVDNTLQFTTVVLDRICDDRFGLIAKVASAPDCPAGSIGTITSTTCQVPQTLAPGASYGPCTFKANFTGEPSTLTDTVTVFGHDQGTTNPRTGSDSAQVAIANVPPAATVVKSLVGVACADVDYHVKVNNTDTGDASLTLSTLTDSTFGSITSVHDNVLATDCTVPQTIAKGGAYECNFRAHFCGGSHTNHVTAALADNEGGTISPDSNDLTVNVCATTSSTTCP